MLQALSRFVRRPAENPSSEQTTLATVNDVATREVVLNGLSSAPPVVNAKFHENNRALWQDLSQQYFPEVENPSHQDPLSFFQTQQNTLDLSLLRSNPTDEILAKKQLTVGLLLRSFAERNPEQPLGQLLKGEVKPGSNLEREALQIAVKTTLEFDQDRVHPHSDLNVVLTTYLGREKQVEEMFRQVFAQIGENLKRWKLEMMVLKDYYYSLAEIIVTVDAQLVRNVAGRITAEVAFRGQVKMVELLYPHLRDCACDVDPKYCVLEKAALAKQRDVLRFLLTQHGADFPQAKREQLLQGMAQKGEASIVEFLLTEFRDDFTARQILSLRGQPGFEQAGLSYWQLIGAPALNSAGTYLGFWGKVDAANTGALVPLGALPALTAPEVLQIEDKKRDGENRDGQRKKLALEGPRAEAVVTPLANAPVFTPSAAARADHSPQPMVASSHSAPVSSPSREERALVPFTKKRPKGGS